MPRLHHRTIIRRTSGPRRTRIRVPRSATVLFGALIGLPALLILWVWFG